MDMINLTTHIGRRVVQTSTNIQGRVIELGNYDDDDDLEFKVELSNGETVIVNVDEGFEAAGLRFM